MGVCPWEGASGSTIFQAQAGRGMNSDICTPSLGGVNHPSLIWRMTPPNFFLIFIVFHFFKCQFALCACLQPPNICLYPPPTISNSWK